MNSFQRKDRLTLHQLPYLMNDPCKEKVPRKDWLIFKPKKYTVPVYARNHVDIECFNLSVKSHSEGHSVTTKTQKIYHQKPCACGSYIQSEKTKKLPSGYHCQFGKDKLNWFNENVIKKGKQNKFLLW